MNSSACLCKAKWEGYQRLLPFKPMDTSFQLKAKSLKEDMHPLQEEGGHATEGEIKRNGNKERMKGKKRRKKGNRNKFPF